jgi:hypothetical protein
MGRCADARCKSLARASLLPRSIARPGKIAGNKILSMGGGGEEGLGGHPRRRGLFGPFFTHLLGTSDFVIIIYIKTKKSVKGS